MEQLTPIILLILWLLVSFLNTKKKPAAPPKAAPQPETTSLPKESELKDLFEDYFGGDDYTRPEKKAIPSKPAAKHESPKETENLPEVVFQETYEHKAPPQREYYGETYAELMQEQAEPHSFEHPSYETVVAEPVIYDQPTTAFEYHESISETYPVSLESMDTSIPEHVELDPGKPEELQEEEVAGKRLLKEFNLRDAVIYSEILNRKYR